MSHSRPDLPQPDPVIRDLPGDLPLTPCPDERELPAPGVPHTEPGEADDEPPGAG